MRGRLRNAFNVARAGVRAALLSPPTYLALYLATIAGFASLYDLRSDAIFYAPYAKLEPISHKDYSDVEMNIFKAIYTADPNVRVDERSGWIVDRDNLDVSELSIEDTGDFSFTISVFARHVTNQAVDLSIGGPVEGIRVSRRLIYIPTDQPFCRLVTLPADWNRKAVLEALFKHPAIMSPALCWDAAAETRFRQMGSGWSGNPKAFSGSYWRMLYLSAITITSVGYGDIVPISNTARFLCGLEAVLGWVIAGLFLSVLTIGRAGKA
ncbi:MAG: hypothetical protein QOJ27_420 [Sphingomonadales bacterium]|nr:hypothetical protein [Sphingomonadales bacterium]